VTQLLAKLKFSLFGDSTAEVACGVTKSVKLKQFSVQFAGIEDQMSEPDTKMERTRRLSVLVCVRQCKKKKKNSTTFLERAVIKIK